MGYPNDSRPISLDAECVDKNTVQILYMFGQLQIAHEHRGFLPIKDCLKKYNGTFWSNEKSSPIFLLHLGMAAGIIFSPHAETKSCLIIKDIPPTLSPEDSGFSEWYPKYKKLKAEGADIREYHKILPKR